jgi:hypothetical protein
MNPGTVQNPGRRLGGLASAFMTQTGVPSARPTNMTFEAQQFCGGSRVIPLNTSLGDHTSKSYNRFVDKNK